MQKLSFSYSKMGLYRECPQKYKFRYIHKLPEKPKYFFAFGSAMHRAMEYIYGVDKPPFPALKQTIEFFDRDLNATSFDEKGYASADKEDEGRAEAHRIITEYYKKYEKDFFVPLSVEMRSTLDIDNLSLISILDRMDYLGDGKLSILDYKTGKTVQREPDQLFMYQKVVESSPVILSMVQAKDPAVKKVTVEKMVYSHLPTLTEMSFERADDGEIAEFWTGVLKTADDIRNNLFAPDPSESKCRFCDFKEFCPVFTGREFDGFKTARPAVSKKSALQAEKKETLSEKIDRYGETVSAVKALKKEILSLMKEQGFNQHFGAKFKAEIKEKTETEFADKEAVIALLKEKKLLNKTLVPTYSTILALLDDAAVKEEDKKELSALIKTVMSEDVVFKKTED